MFATKVMTNMNQYEEYLNERFIYKEELNQILEIMRSCASYRILIVGPAGCGKTTLLHMLSHHTVDKVPYRVISAYEMHNNEGFEEQRQNDDTLFVDGLDEFQNPYEVLQQIIAQNKKRLICTSRLDVSDSNSFTHIVRIKPLTLPQIYHLIEKMGINDNTLPLLNNISMDSLTPRDVLSMVLTSMKNSDMDEFYAKNSNLLYQFGNGIDFSSGIIPTKKKLIVPSKEIITGITIVNDTLLRKAQQNPKVMYSFSSREFEQMICELLEKQGYKVKLTKQTRDGGKDIIILEQSIVGEFCVYVECKKYKENNPISVKLVRELYGTVEAEKATAGMLITTSYFTKDAKEFTKKTKHRMALRDYNDLVQELNKIKC